MATGQIRSNLEVNSACAALSLTIKDLMLIAAGKGVCAEAWVDIGPCDNARGVVVVKVDRLNQDKIASSNAAERITKRRKLVSRHDGPCNKSNEHNEQDKVQNGVANDTTFP